MEKNLRFRFVLLITGTLLFNFLFYKEDYGVNILIFSLFVFTVAYFSGVKFIDNSIAVIIASGFMLTSAAIAYHGSIFAIVMYNVSFILLLGYLHANQLKSVVFIFAASVISSVRFPSVFFKSIPIMHGNKQKILRILKIVKLSLFPLIVFLIFYIIFVFANPVFEKLSNDFIQSISKILTPIFKAISVQRILFIILALYINGWLLFRTDLGKLIRAEALNKEELIRRRMKHFFSNQAYINNLKEKNPAFYRIKFSLSLKLKNEFISALVLLLIVNILLFIVNIIDLKWVWFGFKYSETFDLKQFVHEGTYLLIISILLSIAIMLYFFRLNLNFYPKAKWIKVLAYIWVVQNAFLAISVAIRNFHYITYWGLAYRRIGVILFLIAVIYGLFTVYQKIRYQKTSFFLIKRNSMAIYIILFLASLVNWDGVIAEHNLNHPFKNHIETSYLLSLSDKVLPLIDKRQDVLDQDTKFNTYTSFYPYSYYEYYQKRMSYFIKDYEKNSWLSWNYKNWQAYKHYKLKLETGN